MSVIVILAGATILEELIEAIYTIYMKIYNRNHYKRHCPPCRKK